MNRRQFIELGSAASLGLGLPYSLSAQPLPYTPNVLLILTEDMNDWIGVLGGHPQALTPNLDAFANSGVLFTNAHCSAPLCNASRTSMFTGLMPSTTGVYSNSDNYNDHIPDDYPTLARHFKWQGWHTVRSGKTHHLPNTASDEWDVSFVEPKTDTLKGNDPYLPGHPFSGTNWPSIDGNSFMNWGAGDVAVEEMADYLRANALIDEINAGLPQPSFLAFGTSGTHYPSIVPREYMERFDMAEVELPDVNPDDLDDLPPEAQAFVKLWFLNAIQDHKQWRKAVHAYLAHINYVDAQIGRVLHALDASPYRDNTIVIITADHGFHLGEKRHWLKNTLWEEASHVFMAIRAPELTTPGGRCHEAVSLLDIYPTLCDLADLPAVTPLEGLTLRPQLLDPAQSREAPAITTAYEGNHSVRTERWRYTRYAGGDEELYDHDADTNEWANLAEDPAYDDIKAQLANWLPGG
ncbi:sulfatase [bacterium]|nr:sulfatase [bacterium]